MGSRSVKKILRRGRSGRYDESDMHGARQHRYSLRLTWTGNSGAGTAGYRTYSRNHTIEASGKPPIAGSSDPVFRGDASRYNPEELLVASASTCHMLWYLHLCADHGIVVTAYEDAPEGLMVEDAEGGGRFEQIVLQPHVTVSEARVVAAAEALHTEAHGKCFIANSLNCPVLCRPVTAASVV